ncbi:MAG: hypothetical protein ABL883_12895 [Terricaulis sp.]
MKRKLISVVAAAALALAAIAPDAALAQDRRGYRDDHRGDRHGEYYGGHDYRDYRGYDRHHRRYRRDRDDHGDAVAAGVIGLVLGLAIGAASSDRREPQARCYDNYQRCEPPRRYGGYDQGAYEPGYDDGPAAQQCTRQERQWDRYARRYVIVDVPC